MLPDTSAKIDRLSLTLKDEGHAGRGQGEYQNGWSMVCAEIRKCWASALFSGADEHTIRRYFNFQAVAVAGLFRQLSDDTPFPGAAGLLIALNEHLYEFFGSYLDTGLPVPGIFLEDRLKVWHPDFERVILLIADRPGAEPAGCVMAYLNGWFEGSGTSKYTFRDLNYLRFFLDRLLSFLSRGSYSDAELTAELISLNFNHLLFFAVLRGQLKSACALLDRYEKKEHLEEALTAIPTERNNDNVIIFDPQLPHIRAMFKGWIGEELTLLDKSMATEPGPLALDFAKITIGISVPQLACLIKAYLVLGLPGTANLKAIFKSASVHFRTVKQESISAGSISKEYYGVTQQTAAKVIDMLQKMIAFLKLTYFPVMVAAGITALFR